MPFLDHVLDAIAAPLAVAAGILVSASLFIDIPPLLRWALAIVAGGGSAAVVHSGAALVRLKSSALTGGSLNPAVALLEFVGALLLAVLALLVPLLALASAIVLVILLQRKKSEPGTDAA